MSLLSIIIFVNNGEATLERCLSDIYNQSIAEQLEVIVLGSDSTDNSISIFTKYLVRLFSIDPIDFNHGGTRNFGVSKALGEFILMTVQDACPADEEWLERMLRHFEDKEVIGVCGQQIVPHDADKNPHEWFRPYSEPVVQEKCSPCVSRTRVGLVDRK